MHQGKRMKRRLAARLGCWLVVAMAFCVRAAEYTVDNLAGADANPGTAEAPFKTLAKGLSAFRSGDTLHLVHHPDHPFREALDSSRHPDMAGAADRPTVIDGHGAVVSGLKAFPAGQWQAEGDGVFSRPLPNNAWVMDRQGHWSGFPIVFFDGEPAGFRKTKAELEPRTYFLHKERPATPGAARGPLHNTLYIRLPQGATPDDVAVETIALGTNVHIDRDHVVVRNLTSQYAGVDGFATTKAKHVVFENVRGTRCMDQGISNHGTEVLVRDSRFDGNAGCGNVTDGVGGRDLMAHTLRTVAVSPAGFYAIVPAARGTAVTVR